MKTETISIATKPQVYGVFVYMRNTPYNAFAEYVDNSISSFEKHADVLKEINEGGKVRIDIKISQDEVVIEDNAFGITEDEYARAFELAQPPLDPSGLNEFGMGMKISSIWLSRHWKVESKAFGEDVKKTFEFDLEDVLENERTQADVGIEECPMIDEHYTRITLTKLTRNCPTSANWIKDIANRLASIYSRKINGGIADIYVNDEKLSYTPLKPLCAPYYKNPEGNTVEWKKEIDLSFGENMSVRGFIGVLQKMKSGENGFMLFRRGRAIGTTSGDKYRPKELCGQEGSPQYKMIYGELDIEGFGVTYSKDQFLGDEQFAEMIKGLAEYIKADEELDIIGQAQNYRKGEEGSQTQRSENIKKRMKNLLGKGGNKHEDDKQEDKGKKKEKEPVSKTSRGKEDSATYHMNVNGCEYDLEVVFSNEKEDAIVPLFSLRTKDDKSLKLTVFLCHKFFSPEYYPKMTDVGNAAPVIELLKSITYAYVTMVKGGKPTEAADFVNKMNSVMCNIN